MTAFLMVIVVIYALKFAVSVSRLKDDEFPYTKVVQKDHHIFRLVISGVILVWAGVLLF